MTAPLRHGYTTGACATAAVKGAATMLRDQEIVDEVFVNLPSGETVTFPLCGQRLEGNSAFCFVVKDAGDDPDVTNGVEVHAAMSVEFFSGPAVVIEGGEGIGRVTKPGLAVPVGEWAINPVPRRMILQAVKEVFALRCIPATLTATLSIPDGRERARKTLNERLGIVGGLSILGTTGIVRPISAQAWTDTIDTAIDVARASGSDTVVLSTGRSSEMVAQKALGIRDAGLGTRDSENHNALPEEAFVMMGDHVGHALRSCARKNVRSVVLAGQFAKLLKIACGHEQTHVSSSELDLRALAGWLRLDPATSNLVPYAQCANTARDLLEKTDGDAHLITLVCNRARQVAQRIAPRLPVKVLLAGYQGEVLYFA